MCRKLNARGGSQTLHSCRVGSIGVLKNRYTILQGTPPVILLKHKHDSDDAFIDKLLTVCAALVNLPPVVVPS